MRKTGLSILFSLFIVITFGQKSKDFQRQFQEAKSSFQATDYQRSFDLFKALSTPHKNNKYVEISYYYVGLSAFKMNKLLDARYILGKLEKEYPEWKDIDEARYLKFNVLLEERNLLDGLELFNRIEDKRLKSKAEDMLTFYISTKSWMNLDSLQISNPDNQLFAALALNKLLAKEFRTDAEKMLAMYLVQDYGFDQSLLEKLKVHSRKKEAYNVALMLPLFLENEFGARKYYRFYEMVEGAKLAVEKLNESGIKINLFVFDTEKSKAKVTNFLRNEQFKSMDLLIGPVYPEPSAVGLNYAKENNISCLSPRLNDFDLIEGNQKGYLWLPSNFNVAHTIFSYADKNIKKGKVVILYSGTPDDSLLADTYEALIKQKDSMNVVKLIVKGDNIKKVAKEFYYGEPDETNKAKLKMYGKRKAELSHIVLASKESIVAAELIGVLELNNIDVPVFVPGRTLNINLISPDQFLRRNFIFYHSDYKYSGKAQNQFDKTIAKRLNLAPSQKYIHAYLGYDLVAVLGQELYKNGTSLINPEGDQNKYNCLMVNFSFAQDRTNSYVPLIRFDEELNFDLLNPETNE